MTAIAALARPPAGPVSNLSEAYPVLDSLQDGVVITDSASRIVWANRAYCALTGYPLDAVLGQTPALLHSERTDSASIRELWDGLTNCGRAQARLVNRRADGTFFHASVSVVRLPSDDPAGTRFVATMRDVSVDVEMERRLSDLATQAVYARDTTIIALATLAEQRDRSTGQHLERIEAYTRAIAEWVVAHHPELLPVWARDPDALARCAMLHDIGKVGIPDAVLLKEGKLDDAEQAIMREHPRLGLEILDRVLNQQPDTEFLRLAREIVAYHHEAWDGSGYPFGLKGDHIPLTAQITSVADVLDALTSRRVYKPAHRFEDAVSWIAQRAGTKFAPVAVQAMLAVTDQLERAYRRLGDEPSGDAIGPSGMEGGLRLVAAAPPAQPLPRSRGPSPLACLVEAVNSRAGGEVVVRSGEVVGRIYVFRGNVAWAYLTSQRLSLRERLIEDAALAEVDVDRVIEACKRSGRNFGEVLVEDGLIGRESLRAVMKAHVASRLHAILRLPEPVALFAPQPRSYAGELTFTLNELLAER